MTPEEIRELFAYDRWANARTLDACAALSREQFTRDLGSSFRSVRDTVAHIIGAQWIWLERFGGRSPSSIPPGDAYPDIAALRARWSEIEQSLAAYITSLLAADLDRTLETRNVKGESFRNVLWHMLQHLANHSTYHRGQITMMLRQLGVKPVSTDLIAFYRERASANERTSR